jgi:hypothetical protein
MPTDMLPDDVLLAIFDFCAVPDLVLLSKPGMKKEIEAWQLLVHVCRRWRILVFGSPHRFNLRLVCKAKTPARDTLDVWPALPLLIWDEGYQSEGSEGLDNVISVFERSDRVRQIRLSIPASEWEKVSAAIQVPFPELTYLALWSSEELLTVLPDSFLGGSAPRLRHLSLRCIPFPGLSKLLLSANHLTSLLLLNIPHSGYISPETMATALSALTSLWSLSLEFASPRSRPDQASRRPPPLTRKVLPFLSSLTFKGVSEYLEELVARIDGPQAPLFRLDITFFNDLVFDIPQTIRFIRRTPSLGGGLIKARVFFQNDAAIVVLASRSSGLKVKILCGEPDWQVLSLEQVCTSSLLPLSTLEDLYIYEHPYSKPDWQDKVESTQWLELLQPFTAVKNLYLSKEFAPRILPALQGLVGGRTTEVLPTLQNIFLEELEPSGPVQEATEKFVAARQVTIAVSGWDNSQRDKILS